MKTQVYAVVHDGKGNFLLGYKNEKGYFFHPDTVIPAGKALNGGGLYAIPGGGFEGGGDPAIGGAKEFLEETNVELRNFPQTLSPPDKKWIFNSNWSYYGVYYNLGDHFEEAVSAAANNLVAGYSAAEAVQQRAYGVGQYQELRAAFPGCPQDNELGTIQVWNISNDWAAISQWQNNSNLDWFYNILLYYKNSLTVD